MKRTKDRFGKFEYYNDHNISSLKVFDGEDLEYQDRKEFQNATKCLDSATKI